MSGLRFGGYYEVVNGLSDQQLLQAYVERRVEPAFAELTRRHLDFVYSTALRILGDAQLAEDVTQGVFLALAKDAGHLAGRSCLAGWLHRTARNLAANTVRSESRRRTREQSAAAMNQHEVREAEAVWDQIAPHLDEALGDLGEVDREALISRYFHRKSAREIGTAMGFSEEAAQKRLTRAIERLRALLAARGVRVGACGLGLAISANAVHAAPSSLMASITSALIRTSARTAATSATQTFAMSTIQKTAVAAALAIAVGTGLFQTRQASNLKGELQEARVRESLLAKQVEELTLAGRSALRELAGVREENARLHREAAGLPKLRGEVSRLRSAAETKSDANDPAAAVLDSWLARAREFKRLADRMPEKTIPELRLLTEEDWLELAKTPLGHAAEDVNLADETTARLAFSAVRAKAKDKMMRILSRALEGYAKAHDDELPSDPVQLRPHLMNRDFHGPARVVEFPEEAVDDTVLRRYAVLRAGKLAAVPDEKPILAERTPVDNEYDTRLLVGGSWMAVLDIKDDSYPVTPDSAAP